MSVGLIVRVAPEWSPELPEVVGHLHFASALSKQILNDNQTALGFVSLPSRLLGGSVRIPESVAAALITRYDGSEDGWVDRTIARLLELKGPSIDENVRKEIHQMATHAVNSVPTIWDPWLVRAGVLVAETEVKRH